MDIKKLGDGKCAKVTLEDPVEAMMMTTALLPSASLAGFLIFNLLDYRKFRELQGALSADCYPVQTSMTNRQLAKAGRRLGERALEGWPVAGELVTAISKHLQ